LNEEPNIPRVLEDLIRYESMVSLVSSKVKFLFIDDGSTDQTKVLLENSGKKNLEVISHATNRGPGAAFQTAFSHLLNSGLAPHDLVITLEGDATSDPKVFPRMLKRLEEGDDIVLASPYLYGGGFSEVAGFRLFLSHMANFLFKLILNIHGLATFSCFFRIYRGNALLQLDAAYPEGIVTSPGFDCAAEIVMKAVRQKITISEVPFLVDWSRRKGKSKMRILKAISGYLKLFVRYSRFGNLKKKGLVHENSDHRWSKTPVR